MTWTRIDDRLYAHPKIRRVWQSHPAALGLHLLALSHAAAFLTDGHITEAFVKDQLPRAAQRTQAISVLVKHGLWEDDADEGWWIHDYLDFNESRSSMQQRRLELSAQRAEAGRRGAKNRWQTNGK